MCNFLSLRKKIQTTLMYNSEERQKTYNSVNTEGEKDTKFKKGLSHRDAFPPCSRISSGDRTDTKTKRNARIKEKDRFNQQQGT